jgi:two-component system OmpR family response regulator
LEVMMIPQTVTPLATQSSRPSLDFAPVAIIADDDRVIRELCREVLEAEALRVLTAANGQEALALAEAWIPDVLVTDVVMPSLDGFGLVRALRRLYPEVPVIMITGDDEYEGRPLEEVAAEHGVVATFTKPFDVAQLEAAVRSAVPNLGPKPHRDTTGVRAA